MLRSVMKEKKLHFVQKTSRITTLRFGFVHTDVRATETLIPDERHPLWLPLLAPAACAALSLI